MKIQQTLRFFTNIGSLRYTAQNEKSRKRSL